MLSFGTMVPTNHLWVKSGAPRRSYTLLNLWHYPRSTKRRMPVGSLHPRQQSTDHAYSFGVPQRLKMLKVRPQGLRPSSLDNKPCHCTLTQTASLYASSFKTHRLSKKTWVQSLSRSRSSSAMRISTSRAPSRLSSSELGYRVSHSRTRRSPSKRWNIPSTRRIRTSEARGMSRGTPAARAISPRTRTVIHGSGIRSGPECEATWVMI